MPLHKIDNDYWLDEEYVILRSSCKTALKPALSPMVAPLLPWVPAYGQRGFHHKFFFQTAGVPCAADRRVALRKKKRLSQSLGYPLLWLARSRSQYTLAARYEAKPRRVANDY
jgi:hypothetical protein